jgi:hypothetical protein
MQPETTTESQMEFAEVILVAAALVENFKYKAAFTNTIKIKVSLKKLSKAYAYNTIFTFFFLEYNLAYPYYLLFYL